MKKIIVVANTRDTDKHLIDFACYIAKLTNSRLTGVLMDMPTPRAEPVIYLHQPSASSIKRSGEESKVEMQGFTINETSFKDAFTERGVDITVYSEKYDIYDSIREESRYADLLIIDPGTSVQGEDEEVPTRFVKNILAHAECPVLLSPNIFHGVENIIFCYDGSASSVFAIKQFTCLFPEYSDKNITILHIDQPDESVAAKVNHKIFEWLKPQYASVNFHILTGEAKKELYNYFLDRDKVIVVMGAYGRNLLSYFFSNSSADLLIQDINSPLFITHH